MPSARLGHRLFIVSAYIHFCHVFFPAVAAGAALVTVAAEKVSLITEEVGEAGDIESVGSSAIIILVSISFYRALGAQHVVMIHDIMSQLATAAAQAARPDLRRCIHLLPGAVEG